MAFLTALWLPILLSAVFVFIASSIVHMVLPFHRSDFKKLPNEDAILDTLRANAVQHGSYMFPNAGSIKEMGTPEMCAKFERGPVGWVTIVTPGGIKMGKNMAIWFVYLLIVGTFAAYIGWHTLGAGADYLRVFRIIGAAAILAYAPGHMHDSIWKGVSWGTTFKFVIDGVVYGLITAGTFGWLWPSA